MITKKDLEHLAALARIELREGEEEKLQKDLGNILDYFNELKALNTDSIMPMTGGTDLQNVLREDELVTSEKRKAKSVEDDTGKGPEQFPDKKGGYLRVPPIF